jgi:hypothetical protein
VTAAERAEMADLRQHVEDLHNALRAVLGSATLDRLEELEGRVDALSGGLEASYQYAGQAVPAGIRPKPKPRHLTVVR